MELDQILGVFHVIIAIAMAFGILLQSRASGLSATFGGSGSSSVVQRRGAEMLVFKGTVWLAVIFFGLTIIRWYVSA